MGGEITLKTCMLISLITGDIKNMHADSPNHGRYVLLKKSREIQKRFLSLSVSTAAPDPSGMWMSQNK
jgi:hypothetical protein